MKGILPKGYRPWKMNEVPLGAWIRHNEEPNACVALIVGCSPTLIGMGRQEVSYVTVLDEAEFSVDGGKTWNICGTKLE